MKRVPFEEWAGQSQQKITNFKQGKLNGAKGLLKIELEKSYKKDDRFKLDKKFDDDIEHENLPTHFKQIQQNLVQDVQDEEEEQDQKQIVENELDQEVNQSLSILSKLLPEHQAFINNKPKQSKKQYNLIIQRFDPSQPNKKVIKEKPKIQQKETLKKQNIQKGVDKKEINMNKANILIDKQIKKQRKERKINININSDAWKQISLQNESNKFSLFS